MQMYEINFLILQSKTADLKKLRDSIKDIITNHEADIVEEKEYLKRKLAYEIKHEGYGFYTVIRFGLENKEKLEAIKRELNLNSNIARYIIVRAEHLPSLKEIEEAKEKDRQKTASETIKAEDIEKIISKAKQPEKKQEDDSKKKEPTFKKPAEDEPESQPQKEEPFQREKEKSEKEDKKTSLDDLDKKLDEILNI